MSLKFVSFTAGALSPVLLMQIVSIITMRRSEKISVGTGSNKLMEYRVRGHANFTETVPFALVLLGLAEYNNCLPKWALGAVSTMLLAGRYMHAYAFAYLHPAKVHMGYRVPGMVLTMGALAVSGLSLFAHGVHQFAADFGVPIPNPFA